MTRPVRRLRAALAVLLAAALVVLSPGLEAPRLFAQVVEGGAAGEAGLPASLPAVLSAPAPLSPAALSPSLSAPSALAA
ncbi:MAG: hypothetical protein KGM24_13375, partial [Elusimicrobia bacterium]|nr:hypothetical protein [Elusimicrobiota bacterium]